MKEKNKVIDAIAAHEQKTISQIARIIGKPATNLYDIQKGKISGISEKLAELIIEKFPHYNKIWLLTGEGEMLKAKSSDEPSDDLHIIGNIIQTGNLATLDKAISEISEQRKMLVKSQEQIDRLIAVIEKMADARMST